jgi:hypothetical protein
MLRIFEANAQPFGGNPPSLKWKQVNTDTVRILFPEGMEKQAQEVAAIVQRLNRITLPTIGYRLHKIDIVFQNQTTISNGYVQLAPFRSEFELTADQNSFELGSLPWEKTLAIHEYRHVQQYNNFRVGLSKAFYYAFGEGGQALANSLSIPNWFFEGDAVYQETLVSTQGRGRLPFFFNGYHSLWAADKNYSWMKLRNGSLRDYVPDHYPLGYMLVAYGREKYGEDFWRSVSHDAAAFKGLFYPLQHAVLRNAGISYRQFREDALNYFRQQTKIEREADMPASYARGQLHFSADEEFPQFAGGEKLILMRSSYRNIPFFMAHNLQNGEERKIKSRSVSLNNYFSLRNNMIVYAAYEPDIRWGWRDYGVIRVMDARTGKERRITKKTKYFSPDISADGLHIAAVLVKTDGTSELQILNSKTGEIEQVIPNKEQLFFTYPKFYKEGQLVAAVRNQKGEMALGLFGIRDGAANYLTAFTMNVIGFPSVNQDTIYFTASREGRDRLFCSVQGQLYQLGFPLTNLSTGDYQLQASGGKYVWTSFTAAGYKMNTMQAVPVSAPIPADKWDGGLGIQGIHTIEKGPAGLLDKIDSGGLPISRYQSTLKLFNFHSWRPYVNDPDYSFSLVSQNILNTMQSDVFVGYNRNERFKQIGVNAVYGAFFPVLDAGFNYTFDRNALLRNQKVYWNELQAKAGLSVPLSLSRGRWFTNLQTGSDLVYNQAYFTGLFKDSIFGRGFVYINPYIIFENRSQQARQQINPRFAQALKISYNHAVSVLEANQFLASSYLYFPGLSAVHSFVLGVAFQQRDSMNNARFSNSFPFSRGYASENFYKMFRLGANYHFPLVYPDAGFGNIVYFLRVRANVFFDYTAVLDFLPNQTKYRSVFRSYGSEIYFDTKWWNELPISFGIRYSRLLDPDFEGRGPNQWELILPINLLSR